MPPAPAVFFTTRLIATEVDDSRWREFAGMCGEAGSALGLQCGPPDEGVVEARTRAWIAAQQEHWRSQGFGLWALCEADSGDFVGCAGLCRVPRAVGLVLGDEQAVELLCVLQPGFAGQGLGREIGAALLGVAFAALELPEVVARAGAGDAARQLAGLGFTSAGACAGHDGAQTQLYRVGPAEAQSTAVAIVG